MHRVYVQAIRIRLSSSPISFLPFRAFSKSVAIVNQSSESTPADDPWAATTDDEAEPGLLTNSKPTPKVSLQSFFARAKAISHMAELLRKGVGERELQIALTELPETFDGLLVTQILRADISCDASFQFFQWLKTQHGFKHNAFTYGVMLNNLGRAGRLDQMQQLFEEMKSVGFRVSPVTLSNVMLWYHKAKDMRRLAIHWNTLRRAGTKPSIGIYAAYIDFLATANRHPKIAVLFEEMLRGDCLPSSRLYTVFIEHLVKVGNVDAASKILASMQLMRVVPSRVTYTVVINGFARIKNVDRMLEVLDEMREYFYQPTRQLMPAVIALQDAGMTKEAAALMEEIQPSVAPSVGDVMPSIDEDDNDAADGDPVLTVWRSASCSSFVFDICAFANALQSWDSEVEKMLEQLNIKWEGPLVMGTLRRIRNLDTLWPFFHWLKDKVGFKHDCYSSALLVGKILKSRSTLQEKELLLKDLFEGLKKDGMRFRVQLFNLVIRHYVGVGEADRASSMFNLMTDFGVEPNQVSFALLIQGFSKNHQGREATKFLQQMEEKGFPLDSITCAEFITCLGRAKKTNRAYALFCKMLDSERKPGRLEYKAIMTMYFNVGDCGMALKLYEDMRKAGITPSQDMYDIVTKILHKASRVLDAQRLTEERRLLNFFDGNKKVLQENLLQVLFTFMDGMKPKKHRKASRPAEGVLCAD
ncbi:hypothetical protein GOP47_0006660 [Adiantum capillus-veneris]|uniref:Pentatricopeptide repeat-containing protein n=1 Tax=Adiantum capillus-veneris TaxID=13818 RepID=A0A9D4V3A5_ADICA|nr:hypothetical protein GOP47_0006660 [Adiantum capillus-veneris]